MTVTPVKAPYTCTMQQFLVADGAKVEARQKIAVVESMKMQFDILAPAAGIVRFKCRLGQVIDKGRPMAEIVA